MLRPVAILFLCFACLEAEEATIPGGLSPDGKLGIVVRDKAATPEDSTTYEFVLCESQKRDMLAFISAAGYPHSLRLVLDSEYQAAGCGALWNPTSTAVAFSLRDTKRSRSTTVFTSKNKVFERARLPDAFSLIKKELGITEVNRCYYESPLRWESASVLVLLVTGDCVLPGLPRSEAGRWFEYEVTIDLKGKAQPILKRVALKDHNG